MVSGTAPSRESKNIAIVFYGRGPFRIGSVKGGRSLRWRLGKFLSWIFMRFLWGIRGVGMEDLPPPPVIIAANHSSYMDPPLIMALWPRELYFVAHGGLFVNPIFGAFLRFFHALPLPGAYREAHRLLRRGYDVAIFPEGGRNRLPEVKPGTFRMSRRLGVPVVVFRIHNNDGKPPLKWIRWFFMRDFYMERVGTMRPEDFRGEEEMMEEFLRLITGRAPAP